MASIVTETLKQELIQPVLKNITTGVSPSFYLGLSKSQSWGNGGECGGQLFLPRGERLRVYGRIV